MRSSLYLASCLFFVLLACRDDDSADTATTPTWQAVTFNTGTSEQMGHDDEPDDGYSSQHAAISDAWYGDGLAWLPAVEATTSFFAELAPDIVAFQEIFHSDECAEIPEKAHQDFVCQDWGAGDPTVAQQVLGQGWQVMCNPGKPDKCAAVHERFGRFQGCDEDLCLEGLRGYEVDGCGSGSRVGRAVVERVDGQLLTVVAVHGSSGISSEDEACRLAQFEQIFVDLGDGEPGANGAVNLVLGDLNTDPGRWQENDPSAARFADFAGEGLEFHFLTEVGPDAEPTYQGLLNIDHVVSDALQGSCWAAGLDGHPAVIDAVYFDHLPQVCQVES